MQLDRDLDAILGEEAQAPPLSVVTEQTVNPMQVQWARFKPMLADAVGASGHDIEDLERKIGQGRAFLFPGKEAAVIGEKANYGGEEVFQVLWAVGDMKEVIELSPGIEAFARLIGCKSMLVEGRRGWEKTLKPYGYEFWSITLRKGL